MSLRRCLVKLNFIFRQSLKHKRKSFFVLIWTALICFSIIFVLIKWNNDPMAIEKPFYYIEPINSYFRFKHSQETKDWHDYKMIEREALRDGPGEQGKPVMLEKDEEEIARKIFEENKHNGLVSDKIARDRAIPDTRPTECRQKTYLKDLPSVSVIIPFHNEILSTLTRTIHSVINRSPSELLKEVILVNDHSDKDYCYGPLEDYIREHFDAKIVKILVMPIRSGLMWARLAGARYASSDVLVFMDCHMEANVNWLPPLIEPIAINYRTCTCPYIDVVDAKDYRYRLSGGSRGAFTWNFFYQFLPLRPEDQKSPSDNFKSGVMMGCIFSISAKFFWELGGYDTGLSIWGGEQYELTFKVWLCNGEQYDVPCSRVAHLYRPRPFTNVRNQTDYYNRNYKRVAEIWMDDYAQHIYSRNPDHWNKIDAGDTSYMKGIKKKLNCKPFKYFLEHVVPDMLDRFPPIEPPEFASGAIQNDAHSRYCIDTLGVEREQPVGLYACKEPLTNPGYRQMFKLRNHRDISIEGSNSDCLDLSKNQIVVYACKFEQSNQYFRYDLQTKQIFGGPKRDNMCIDMDLNQLRLFTAPCDANKLTQKWTWGFVNETMLENWASFGKPIRDELEMKEFEN